MGEGMGYEASIVRNYSEIRARLMGPPPAPRLELVENVVAPEPLPEITQAPKLECVAPIIAPTPEVLVEELRQPTVAEIQQLVCRRFKLSKVQLLAERRTRDIVRPRQIAMHLAVKLTTCSLPLIGRLFNGRDHTTVLHANSKVKELCAVDGEVASVVEELTEQLRPSRGHDDESTVRTAGDSDQALCPGEV